jgi:hypothetical protein
MPSRLQVAALALSLALAPARARAAEAPVPPDRPEAAAASTDRARLVSVGIVGGIHAGMWVWAYFAWYRDMPTNDFRFGGDGFFGRDTYAGGADKLGHLWSGNMLSRTGTEVLLHGGWKPLPASLIGSGLGFLLLGAVEVKDAYYTEFSPGDLLANLTGAALNVLLVNVPAVDDAIDYRVEYLPSLRFRRSVADEANVDVANDYSGQTYFLAFHLKSIDALGERPWLGWTGYLDLVAGFETRDYLPAPADADTKATQHLFVGAALNLQHVLDALGVGEGDRHALGHVVFEFLSPPYTVLPAAGITREGTRPEHAG